MTKNENKGLSQRHILLCVTGGIAAYKSAFLIRLLAKEGYSVQPVMTEAATSFITPLTLSTLSGKPVLKEFFNKETGEWNNHIRLAEEADLILLAPLTAETLSKMASGGCDNLVTAIYLSSRSKVMAAPAMDYDMFRHPAIRQNMETIQQRGCKVVPAEAGELASGLSGEGRMAEPESILEKVNAHFQQSKSLHGKKLIVSAGPTYEPIDPVRFLGNNSSGKMGFALAEELAERGAEVNLVTGPTALTTSHSRISVNAVKTAEEMRKVLKSLFPDCDGLFKAAAVADYKPATFSDSKIKKEEKNISSIELTETSDILQEISQLKKEGQFVCGFSLETGKGHENAMNKLKSKNLDMIVLNSLIDKGAGFEENTNKVTIFDKQGKEKSFPLKDKKEVAVDIVDFAEPIIHQINKTTV